MGKYFGTDGFRGEANKNLDFEHAIKIGRFLGWYYGANMGKKAKVGGYQIRIKAGGKLIKTVNMNVETQEYETLMANLQERVKELGGYVQNMESHNGSAYSYSRTKKYANLTIRIPQQKLDEFVGSVSDLANVVSRSESVDDVTLQYVDMQSHKESLQVEQARLLELLERAESLEDIITLENRLTSVRYQIESMESSLRTFDDQVDYSTVYLRVDEVQVFTVVEEEEETVWERMVNGFKDSLTDVKDGFVDFGVWFVVNIPYLVIWAVVITIAILIFKKIRKKKGSAEKKEKKAKGKQQQGTTEAESPVKMEEDNKITK